MRSIASRRAGPSIGLAVSAAAIVDATVVEIMSANVDDTVVSDALICGDEQSMLVNGVYHTNVSGRLGDLLRG